MTSSIARMNCFLHGIEDFRIERGDTLAEPKFVQGDRLMQFDVVLANPPYSIKQWDRDAFAVRPLGPQPLRHPAAGPRRLRLLAAHPVQPGAQDWPLRHPVPARRALPPGGSRHAAQAHRSRPHRVRPRPRAEPLLQLADGSLRRHLPHGQAEGARKARSCSSTPSTRSPASAPRASSPTTTSSASSRPTRRSRMNRASPAWLGWRKSAPRTATSASRSTSLRSEPAKTVESRQRHIACRLRSTVGSLRVSRSQMSLRSILA